MKKSAGLLLAILTLGALTAALLLVKPKQGFTPAPPAGMAAVTAPELPDPPSGAIAFDLKYTVQTGRDDDQSYFSFWGFGGSTEEQQANSFLKTIQTKGTRLYYVQNSLLRGRQWAAVEHNRRKPLALYFDLDADGKLSENERILPTRRTDGHGVEFITPDFMLELGDGVKAPFRVLLRAEFYGSEPEPNCMWSPACLLEGTATVEGKPARLLLFADGFGGKFDRFGGSMCALLLGDRTKLPPRQYVPRDALSSRVYCNGQFYRLQIEGKSAGGHPARALLVKDTTPTGSLAVKLAGGTPLEAKPTYLYLHGVDDPTVYFNFPELTEKLPALTYRLQRGGFTYGKPGQRDWEVAFSEGPNASVEAGNCAEVTLGKPALTVRVVEERERHNSMATDGITFRKGTRLYLEPKVTGKGNELFSRFRHQELAGSQMADTPPKVTITAPDGKVLVSKTMEYG